MIYGDEAIIKNKNKVKRIEGLQITKTVIIDDEKLTFERRYLFNGKFSIILPEQFDEMETLLMTTKYPSENRPQLILSNRKRETDITFSYLDVEVPVGELEEAFHALRTVIKRMFPASPMIKKHVLIQTESAGKLYYFSFKHNTLDATTFNIMWTCEIGHKMLIGSFNCMYDIYRDWEPLMEQIFESMIDLTKEESPC